MSPCTHSHDVVSRHCTFGCGMSCQDHLGDDEEPCCIDPDQTAGSFSLSWNNFNSFELATQTNESSICSHWEDMRSIWSPRLHPLSDLVMPASIFDVTTSSIHDGDAGLPKVYPSSHNHFMAPIGTKSKLPTELGSNQSPISRMQLGINGRGPSKSLEQLPFFGNTEATNPLPQSLTSATGWPVLGVSRCEENVFSNDPRSTIALHSTELPMYFSSSSNLLSNPFTAQNEPPHLTSHLLDSSYTLHDDLVLLGDRVNNYKSLELQPYFHSTQCARMRYSIMPTTPQSVLGELSFKHHRDPLVPLSVFDIAPPNSIQPPLDDAKEIPLAMNCELQNSLVSLANCTDSNVAFERTGEAASSIDPSYSCSKILSSWHTESLSTVIKNSALPAAVPSTSHSAHNFGRFDRKIFSCITNDQKQMWDGCPKEAVSPKEKHSGCRETGGKSSHKQFRRRKVGKPGSSPLQVYRYFACPSYLNVPIRGMDNLFYLDIAIEEDVYFRYLGRIVIKTIPELAPRMSENFAILCERRTQSYRGCSVFQCWVGQSILTGDTSGKHGRGGKSAYGGNFLPDQNDLKPFHGAVAMRRYRKGFSSQGYVGSQFRIFLTKHLNMGGIFGVVVSGLAVAHALGNLGDRGGRPTRNAIIAECGRLDVE